MIAWPSTNCDLHKTSSPCCVSMFSSSLRKTNGFKYGTLNWFVCFSFDWVRSVLIMCMLSNGTVAFLHLWHVVLRLESSADQPAIMSLSIIISVQLWHGEQVLSWISTSDFGLTRWPNDTCGWLFSERYAFWSFAYSPRNSKLLKLDFRESLSRLQRSTSLDTRRECGVGDAYVGECASKLSSDRCDPLSKFMDLIGVLLAEMASLISSNFLATDVAALFILLRPPWKISFDFLPVKLGLNEKDLH